MEHRLDRLTTDGLSTLLQSHRVVALVPVGSVEPHGPHVPLATDTLISLGAAERAAAELTASDIVALVAPAVPYGVTDYAAGFAGAVSIPADVLTPFLNAVVRGYLDTGLSHVCLVNNHLEPAQDAAVRAALEGVPTGRASIACPLTRRWGRLLSDEYKSGACHAGQYETSLVLAVAPEAVDREAAAALPALETSLSEGIKAGKKTFRELGLADAYTGAPAAATEAEGHEMLARLATMIVTEVREGLASTGEG